LLSLHNNVGLIDVPRAYVLFNLSSGAEDQVLKDAKKTGGVVEAYISYGVYDLIVKVKAESMEELKELVTYKLRAIENVRSTLTLMLTEE
jgi:DNA-binding Lrp family transcriptional regulator